MKLVKHHRPYGVFDGLFEGMNRGLYPALSPSRSADESQTPASQTPALRLPRTNIVERDDSFEFTMEMPGLDKKDVDVSLENDTLTVKGEKSEENEDAKVKGLLRREIRSSKFERRFSLGNEVDQENIKAKMNEGVLTVILAKKSDKVGRRVDVD